MARDENKDVSSEHVWLSFQLLGRSAMIAGAFAGALLTEWRPSLMWALAGAAAFLAAGFGVTTPAGSGDRAPAAGPAVGVRAEMRKPIVLLLLASGIAFGVEAGVRNLIYQPYVVGLGGGSAIYLAYFQAALAMARIGGILLYKHFLTRFERGNDFVLLALLLFAGSELVAARATSWLQFLPLYVIGVCALGWYFPLRAAVFNDAIHESRRATMISIASMLESAASGLACVALAFRIESASLASYWIVGCVALATSALLFGLAVRRLAVVEIQAAAT